MTGCAFESAAISIVGRVQRRRSPAGKSTVWASIVSQFGEGGHCDARLIDVVEKEIRGHLRSLRVAVLRDVWAGSELGMSDPDDVDLIPTSELRRLLEPVLLSRITEIAVDEAGDHDPR